MKKQILLTLAGAMLTLAACTKSTNSNSSNTSNTSTTNHVTDPNNVVSFTDSGITYSQSSFSVSIVNDTSVTKQASISIATGTVYDFTLSTLGYGSVTDLGLFTTNNNGSEINIYANISTYNSNTIDEYDGYYPDSCNVFVTSYVHNLVYGTDQVSGTILFKSAHTGKSLTVSFITNKATTVYQ